MYLRAWECAVDSKTRRESIRAIGVLTPRDHVFAFARQDGAVEVAVRDWCCYGQPKGDPASSDATPERTRALAALHAQCAPFCSALGNVRERTLYKCAGVSGGHQASCPLFTVRERRVLRDGRWSVERSLGRHGMRRPDAHMI